MYKLTEEETQKLIHMEDELHKRIIGQEAAVAAVSQSIRRTRAGLKDPKRPSGSFIFLGPTGVGKTELAKTLAEFLFGDDSAMITLDMSEYMEKHTVSRLVGSPPGYVGYEEGGQLTEAVRRKPFSVVLFDEIEKAHPDVFNTLLQILEEGRLTDSQGRTVDFRNTVLIMTSNLGTQDLRKANVGFTTADSAMSYERMKEKVMDALKVHFRPEFLNRIDEVIVFHELNREEVLQMVDNLTRRLTSQLEGQGLGIELTQSAKELLAVKGYDPQLGARPLRRAIQRQVEDPLSEMLLFKQFHAGEIIVVDTEDDPDKPGEQRIKFSSRRGLRAAGRRGAGDHRHRQHAHPEASSLRRGDPRTAGRVAVLSFEIGRIRPKSKDSSRLRSEPCASRSGRPPPNRGPTSSRWRRTPRRRGGTGCTSPTTSWATASGPATVTPMLEATAGLAGLAALTDRVRLGSLVFGITYRHPAVLAKWAATVDQISAGRLLLGVGAGWQENEHEQYGIELGPPGVRIDRFVEALDVLTGLLREPVTTVTGKHYTLTDAVAEPKPVQDPLPLLIGGKGDRMLGVVARYADEWNIWALPEDFAERSAALDERCAAIGRDPATIARSCQALWFVTDDSAKADALVGAGRTTTGSRRTGRAAGRGGAGAGRRPASTRSSSPTSRSARGAERLERLDLIIEQVAPAVR